MNALLATGLLLCGVLASAHGEPVANKSARVLAEAMRAARESDGFELRVTLQGPGATAPDALRIALIGQSREGRERLLARGIAPAGIRGHAIVCERSADPGDDPSCVQDASADTRHADPMAGIFGSALVAWDLMAPWWDWPVQIDEGPMAIAGHACTQVRSRPERRPVSGVSEALSCVDARNAMAWKTTLFDSHHRVLRSIEVRRDIRTQAGHSTARSAAITDADGTVTLVDVYAGDEHYQVRPDTFATSAPVAPAKD